MSDRDTRNALALWTVYENPTDYPGWFVARLSYVEGGAHRQTDNVFIDRNLESLRKRLPRGLTKLARVPYDDPVIVEVWL